MALLVEAKVRDVRALARGHVFEVSFEVPPLWARPSGVIVKRRGPSLPVALLNPLLITAEELRLTDWPIGDSEPRDVEVVAASGGFYAVFGSPNAAMVVTSCVIAGLLQLAASGRAVRDMGSLTLERCFEGPELKKAGAINPVLAISAAQVQAEGTAHWARFIRALLLKVRTAWSLCSFKVS